MLIVILAYIKRKKKVNWLHADIWNLESGDSGKILHTDSAIVYCSAADFVYKLKLGRSK